MEPQLTVAGYSTRSPTLDDVDAVTSLINACEVVDLGEPIVEASDITADWTGEQFDLARDVVLVVAADGGLVAAASVEGRRGDADVHPEHRGRGIGSFLLDWLEHRVDEITGTPGAPLGQTLGTRPDGGLDLLRSRGYVHGWDSWLLRYPTDKDLPLAADIDGITLRQATREDDAAVHATIERAFDWPGRSPKTFERWRQITVGHDCFEPALMRVACDADSGAVVGACVALRYPDEGWIEQLAVDATHRGRGIGRALMSQVFAHLRATGSPLCGLNTDSRTSALDLYTRFGMEVVQTLVHLDRPSGQD